MEKYMAEVNTAEKEAKAEAAFSIGFDDTPPVIPAKVVEKPEAVPVKPVAVAPAIVPPKPEYVRVTKQERDNDKAAIGKIAVLESALAKLTGSIPKADQIVQQAIEKVRAETPAGMNVEITDEDFAEMAADFPELAKTSRAALEKIFKKANVRGTATAPDPDAINKAVDARLKARDDAAVAATREKEMTGLQEVYPEWGKIVGQPIAMGTDKPVETPWRKWATTNDLAALSSDSPAEVQASIAKFMASQKKPTAPAPPDRAAARRSVIEDAVTPRADGSPPPIAQRESAEDAFGSGFKAARRH